LSTIDVHAAFHLIAGPLGLAGAVAVTLLVVAAIPLALVLGFAPVARLASPRAIGALAAGAGAALLGQAVAAATVLHWPAAPHVASALALGGGLRALFETFYLFAALAIVRASGGFPRAVRLPAAPVPAYSPTMPKTCNIDARGKRARLIAGLSLVAWAGVLCAIWALPVGGPLPWTVAGACLASGAFLIYEARTGWCAVRAWRGSTKG
jgi:hypothetical protein